MYIIFLISIVLNTVLIDAATIYDRPGHYTLGSSLTAGDLLPIEITSSHVGINLNFKELSGSDMGIIIDANLTDIFIHDGTLFSFTGTGIYIGDGCSDVRIDNIRISNCGQAGILFDGNPFGAGIQDCKVSSCMISDCIGSSAAVARGLHAIATTNLQVVDSNFTFNDATTTNTGYGLFFDQCSGCEVTHCKALDNGGNVRGVGFFFSQCVACSVGNCTALSNIAHEQTLTATGCGFLFDGCNSFAITGCRAADNTVNLTNNSAEAIGFLLMNGQGNGITFCTSQGNIGTHLAAGFCMTGSEANTAILSSQGVANQASFINGQAYGILIDGPQGCAIADNIISANLGATGVGLKDSTTNTSNYIAGNLCFTNTTTCFQVTRTTGALPVVFASVDDFTNITTISKYPNVGIN